MYFARCTTSNVYRWLACKYFLDEMHIFQRPEANMGRHYYL